MVDDSLGYKIPTIEQIREALRKLHPYLSEDKVEMLAQVDLRRQKRALKELSDVRFDSLNNADPA